MTLKLYFHPLASFCWKPLIPFEPDRAWQVRMWDRVFDHYVHEPMQKIVLDRLRPAGKTDSFGVEQARAQLADIYGFLEQSLGSKTWMTGEEFTLAECSAAPALFYANTVAPIGASHKNLSAYLDRLAERPSFARVLEEAEPYFEMFPLEQKPEIKTATIT